MIDVPIPETGWERCAVDPETTADGRAWAFDSVIAAIAPCPAWLYAAIELAGYHNSPIRLHPAEYERMLLTTWAVWNRPPLSFGSPVLGTEVIVDMDTPEGVVRITDRRRPAFSEWAVGV